MSQGDGVSKNSLGTYFSDVLIHRLGASSPVPHLTYIILTLINKPHRK